VVPPLPPGADRGVTAVSIAIMAHPERAAWVDELRAELGPVPVAWARPPWATVRDRGPVWRTCREAMLLHADAPYHCVLQDDTVLGADFRARLECMVEAGEYIYCLFWRPHHGYPMEATIARRLERVGHFTKLGGSMFGVGMVYPTRYIADIVAFGDRQGRAADDMRVRGWAIANQVETYVPLPSLVDHRGDRSLHDPNLPIRKAWRFA
jgi:hypothetical protein